MGGAMTMGSLSALLSGCSPEPSLSWTPVFFDKEQIAVVTRVADLIIPKTDTPGALDAGVVEVIDRACKDLFSAEEQAQVQEGMKAFNTLSQSAHQKNYVDLKEEDQAAILQMLADESKETEGPHIFSFMKDMVVASFFTSEVAAMNVLNYDPIPTRYDGCIELSEVGSLWAEGSGSF